MTTFACPPAPIPMTGVAFTLVDNKCASHPVASLQVLHQVPDNIKASAYSTPPFAPPRRRASARMLSFARGRDS